MNLLRAVYLERRKKNKSYSTSAFARDLKVSQAYASLLLNGKRKVPLKRAIEFCQALRLSPAQSETLLQQVTQDWLGQAESTLPQETKNYLQLEADRFSTISSFIHFAILDFTTVKGFKSDANWVSKKLGVKPLEVQDAVDRLTRLGLLTIQKGIWKKAQAFIEMPSQNGARALRELHSDVSQRAQDYIDAATDKDSDTHEFGSVTMAIDPSKLALVKNKIRTFQKEMTAILTNGDPTSLYQFNIQLFSLLEKKENKDV